MNTIIVSKGVNGGFVIVVNGFTTVTNTINYRTGSSLELYDSLDKLICVGEPTEFSTNIDGVITTGFTNIGQVLDALSNVKASISSGTVVINALTDGTAKVRLMTNDGSVISPNGNLSKLTATLTRPADTNNYAAGDHISNITIPVKQKNTVTLSGTEGSVNISIPNIVNRTIAFTVDLTTTAAAFVTDYAADFLPLVVVTSSGADIIFEAATAGVPFSLPVVTNTITDLTGTVVVTTANATLSAIQLVDASISNGGGGMLMDVKVETDAVAFAGQTIRIWLFNDIPSGIVGDNVAYINSFVNANKRAGSGYIDIVFDALLTGSDCVIGVAQPTCEYICKSTSKDLYILIQVITAITTPESSGIFNFTFNVIKMS